MTMQTNQDFELALDLLQNTGINLFLTGKAGTGKTTFLKRLKEISPKRMIVVAPTGVAAINAGGVTIHSFFQLSFGPYLSPTLKEEEEKKPDFKHQFRKEKINILRSMDLLVIDEVSMVRADVLDAISDILRRYRDGSKPFGGVQLLLIGDLQQLAPVAKEDEWNVLKDYYPSTFFFESKALAESSYFCIELTHVYRQNDTHFIQLLNNIRENRFDDATLAQLNQRYIPNFRPAHNSDYITLTTHNYQAQQINSRNLAELPDEPYTFTATIENDFPEYSYPTDEQLTLKRGAQVMFVKNDSSSEKRYYNGKIGKIVFINADKITVADETGQEIDVEKETWSNLKYTIDPETQEIVESVSGTFCQYPLKTAWAITIHKSQGLTFDHAIIDVSAAFSHGQAYVALSRCKTLEGVVLNSPITRNAMISDSRINAFISASEKHYPDKEQLYTAKLKFFMSLLTELFDFSRMQQQLQYAAYVVYTHLQKLYPELNVQYGNTRDAFRTTVTDVGARFIQQLTQMSTGNPDCQHDERIQERVRKGCAYFLEQIDRLCTPLLEASQVEIDNKETRKTVNNALNKFKEELRIKQQTLDCCQAGFTVSAYLSAKAKANIDLPPAKKKKEKGEKAAPPEKIELSSDIKHPELYAALRHWRYELSTTKKLPAYLIMQQKALIGITNILPTSANDLLIIPGIGKKLIENYGAELIALVEEYKKNFHDVIDN